MSFLHALSAISARAEEGVNQLTIRSPYGYIPEKAPGIAFLVVFALGTLIHIVLGIKYRYWLVFATLVPGGLRECCYPQMLINADLSRGHWLGRATLVILQRTKYLAVPHADLHVSTVSHTLQYHTKFIFPSLPGPLPVPANALALSPPMQHRHVPPRF